MTITQITYERVYNLGSYESERISATATVENDDLDAAFSEARTAVEYEHTRTLSDRKVAAPTVEAGASYEAPPASDKQRNYIATLQDKLGWTSEQMAVYAAEQGVDLVGMTKAQASALIEGLKRLADQQTTESGIIRWAERVVTPKRQEELTREDIPF